MATESARLFGAELMSPDDVAAALGISPATIRRWLREGAISGVKVGRQWRVNVTLVRDKIASGELAVNIERKDTKTLKRAADVLTSADEDDWPQEIRYVLNALRYRLTDDRDMAAFLVVWQQEIAVFLESLDGKDPRESASASPGR